MSVAGMIGSGLTSFSGDPKFRTLTNVKSPAAQQRIKGLYGEYDSSVGANKDALSEYIQNFLSGQKTAESNTAGEVAPLNRLYGGGVETDLANLRAGRTAAINKAATTAGEMALARANRSVVGADGSGSSYRDRLLMSATQPYAVQAAADEAQQARQDYGDVIGQQFAMAGRRQAMEDQLIQRGLTPAAAKQAALSSDTAGLQGILGLENANNIYGVQQKTTGLQRWGKFLQDAQGYQDKDMATMAQSY
jgi:hypothetical protein